MFCDIAQWSRNYQKVAKIQKNPINSLHILYLFFNLHNIAFQKIYLFIILVIKFYKIFGSKVVKKMHFYKLKNGYFKNLFFLN